MKSKFLKGFLLAIIIATAIEYSRWTYISPLNAYAIVAGLDERPFVYRMLIPALAWLLSWLGVPIIFSLRLVVVLSSIGLFYALKYLFTSFKRK